MSKRVDEFLSGILDTRCLMLDMMDEERWVERKR
jgi:hypothetical protein